MSAGEVLSNIASNIEQSAEITIVNTRAEKNSIIIRLVGVIKSESQHSLVSKKITAKQV